MSLLHVLTPQAIFVHDQVPQEAGHTLRVWAEKEVLREAED